MASYSPSFAEGSPYILLRPIMGIEQMPPTLNRQLQRTSLQIIAKQPGYDLLLSGEILPESSLVPVFAVEGQVSRNGRGFSIEVRLLDIKSKQVVTKASRENIREEDLIRLYQAALESLFIPDNKPTTTKEEEPIKEVEIKKTKVNKKSFYVSPPAHRTIDFKKRILALQRNTDIAIAELKEEVKKPEDNETKKEIIPTRSLASDGILEIKIDSPLPKRIESRKFNSNHRIGLGYSIISVNSDYFINTTTSIHALSLNGNGHMPFSFFDGKVAFSYESSYSKVVSSTVKAPSLYSISPGFSWLNSYVNLGLYLSYETSFFTNIDQPGAGLKVFSLDPLSARIKAEFDFHAITKWNADISYSQIISANSNYRPLSQAKSWSGSSFKLALSPNYNYKDWRGVIHFEKSNLTSQGEKIFSYNDTRSALAVRRSF